MVVVGIVFEQCMEIVHGSVLKKEKWWEKKEKKIVLVVMLCMYICMSTRERNQECKLLGGCDKQVTYKRVLIVPTSPI